MSNLSNYYRDGCVCKLAACGYCHVFASAVSYHIPDFCITSSIRIVPAITIQRTSRSWLLNFKRKYNIVSRSITHKVGKTFWKKRLELEAKAVQFVDLVKKIISEKNYEPHEVINIDQSRFDKELHSYRSLAFKGAKQVFVTMGSKNAATHSYMVMGNIDASGTVMDFLYLKSQEANGKFPEIIKPIIPDNIKAYAGTSAMMTNADSKIYLDLLFQYLISKGIKKCLLLADSWSSNKNTKLFEEVLAKYEGRLKVERLLIPEGTTGMIQPLNVYYFRPYKQFVRHISDSLEVCDGIWKRDNYFKLQALAHFQFQAPMFRDMVKYAFYKAGLSLYLLIARIRGYIAGSIQDYLPSQHHHMFGATFRQMVVLWSYSNKVAPSHVATHRKHPPTALRASQDGRGRCFCTRTSRMAPALASQDSAAQNTLRDCCEPELTIANPQHGHRWRRPLCRKFNQQEVTRGVTGTQGSSASSIENSRN
ncbi:hypothetical protein DMN91_006836 [Ooceraea biroi]|uniref:DDE-1 domain-containing protein n=1 Tax=Ooceraea biroi TaxID=2015173 RepID=A0A3L8DK00_OOCBI|nr:hypothetical protein DMN91_006836 [Ooceraea biroi]